MLVDGLLKVEESLTFLLFSEIW